MDLFSEDINMRAALYADKRASRRGGEYRLWQAIADAYVEGARSQANLMERNRRYSQSQILQQL